MYLRKKSAYKWTCTVHTHVVQGSAVVLLNPTKHILLATNISCSLSTNVFEPRIKYICKKSCT